MLAIPINILTIQNSINMFPFLMGVCLVLGRVQG